MKLATAIKQKTLEIGFDLAGVSPLTALTDLEFARQWVQKGYGGEMRYLANPQRRDPRLLLPSAKSVVCVGLGYNTPYPYSTEVARERVRSQKSEASSRQAGIAGQVSGESADGQRTTANGQPASLGLEASVLSRGAGARAWISRYAWGQDYHEAMRAKLEQLRVVVEGLAPGAETRVFVDTGPIVERAFARLSGIGWMGKNTCLINESKGSWFFLGVLLTSLELEPDLPAPDRCGSCTACLEACPTGALIEPYVMDASRCISYFTIELKGSIPEEFRPKMGLNVFGCDICQDVCPWNSKSSGQSSVVRGQLHRGVQPSAVCAEPSFPEEPPSPTLRRINRDATTDIPEFQPMSLTLRPACPELPGEGHQPTTDDGQRTTDSRSFSLFHPSLAALASLNEQDFRRVFRRSAIRRAKYRGWLRNLCVAMGNSGDSRFVPWLKRACEYPDPVAREHATWALQRLSSQR